ncbi:MAG: endonuclease VII domain-containing protein [Patescibacteria group bacterium]|jgi:hypothetical protein
MQTNEEKRAYGRNYYKRNRKKLLAKANTYHNLHKEERIRKSYEWRLKTRYNLTEAQYEQMIEAQQGYCALCKNKPTGRLCVDHNHKTGKVRELLCVRCNAGLGNFTESLDKLYSAIEYLKKHNNLLVQ